jgi:hypothetical protein
LHVSRRDRTVAVARCQVVPIDVDVHESVTFTVRERSAETVTKADVLNKEDYQVTWTPSGLDVRDAQGAKPPPERAEQARVARSLAAALVGWPGAIASRRQVTGQALTELEDPLKRIVDLQLHGAPATVSAKVRSRGTRSEPWGDALVFDAEVDGTTSSAGMCHRWASDAHSTGELTLRASDGAIITLHLQGDLSDSEALCPEGARETGRSAEPKRCNRGETSFDLQWSCAP